MALALIACTITAGEILTESWGTSLLAGADMFGTMVTVALPSGVLGLSGTSMSVDDAEAVQNTLYERYNIEVSHVAIHTSRGSEEESYLKI